MWDGVSAVIETIAAYVLLGERLNTGYQYIGLCMLIAGLFILRRGGISY